MIDLIEGFNAFAWIASNLLIAYIAITLTAFVIAYVILFDPGATTGGKFIFHFMVSLVGIIGMVFVGIFIDPTHNSEWFNYPTGEVLSWRPIVRLITYCYVAYSVTSLFIVLALRKWWPEKLRTADDLKLVSPRNTGSIQTHSINKK